MNKVNEMQALGDLYDSLNKITGRDFDTYQRIIDEKARKASGAGAGAVITKVGQDKLTDAEALEAGQKVIKPVQERVASNLGINNTNNAVPSIPQAPKNTNS